MKTSFLICESKLGLAQEVQGKFQKLNFECDVVTNGKDAQLKLFKNKYQVAILDINLKSNNSVEVMKYIRQNQPQVKLILVFNSKEEMNQYNISEKDMQALSIFTIFGKYSAESILNLINDKMKMFSWNMPINHSDLYKEIPSSDNNFTQIKIEAFLSQNHIMYDLYIKLSKDKYVKIVNRGETLDSQKLLEYSTDNKVPYLYFLTKERSQFIGCLNEVSKKVLSSPQYSINQKVDLVNKSCEFYVDTIYTQGISDDCLEEGLKICSNIFDIAKQDSEISDLFNKMNVLDTTNTNKTFLTALFCSIICRNLSWSSANTTNKIIMAAFLHDLGKIKIHKSVQNKNIWELTTQEEKKLYFDHIKYSMELLGKCKKIPTAVLAIIEQHHEYMDGKGYPFNLSGSRIYPLAKILCFASELCEFIFLKKLDVKECLSLILKDKQNLEKYDPLIIKAFVGALVGKNL